MPILTAHTSSFTGLRTSGAIRKADSQPHTCSTSSASLRRSGRLQGHGREGQIHGAVGVAAQYVRPTSSQPVSHAGAPAAEARPAPDPPTGSAVPAGPCFPSGVGEEQRTGAAGGSDSYEPGGWADDDQDPGQGFAHASMRQRQQLSSRHLLQGSLLGGTGGAWSRSQASQGVSSKGGVPSHNRSGACVVITVEKYLLAGKESCVLSILQQLSLCQSPPFPALQMSSLRISTRICRREGCHGSPPPSRPRMTCCIACPQPTTVVQAQAFVLQHQARVKQPARVRVQPLSLQHQVARGQPAKAQVQPQGLQHQVAWQAHLTGGQGSYQRTSCRAGTFDG